MGRRSGARSVAIMSAIAVGRGVAARVTAEAAREALNPSSTTP